MENVLLFFIDGLGIGTRGSHNPFDGLSDAEPLAIFQNEEPQISVTTAAVEAAGLRFNTVEDLNAGRAVYQDFTNAMLIERGEEVAPRTPEQAGDVLASITKTHRFTLYEYFLTDKVGHAQNLER